MDLFLEINNGQELTHVCWVPVVPRRDVVHVLGARVAVHARVEDDGCVELASEARGDGEAGWAAANDEDVAEEGGHCCVVGGVVLGIIGGFVGGVAELLEMVISVEKPGECGCEAIGSSAGLEKQGNMKACSETNFHGRSERY
jgi:hypothetical protein